MAAVLSPVACHLLPVTCHLLPMVVPAATMALMMTVNVGHRLLAMLIVDCCLKARVVCPKKGAHPLLFSHLTAIVGLLPACYRLLPSLLPMKNQLKQ
jgi:hypothetical protein